MSLKKQAVSGVKWTSISAIVSSIIQLLQVAVLARFLDKDDFGLMAMALFVIGISKIFIDMGVSNALIHKQNVNKFQLSTLFWTNIIIGVIIFSIIFASSPLIADIYETSELKGVINWIAITFLILPFGQQFDALLRRDMRFKSLAVRDVLSKAIGLVIAIVLAIKGFGVYALVYANVASALVATLLLFIIGIRDYKPKFVFSYRSLKNKGFFSFGLFQMGEKTINYFNSNFDTLLIGKLLGMEALGVYNIAKMLAIKPYQILNPIITKVAFPTFSKVQNETKKLKKAYLRVVSTLVSFNAPIYIFVILIAEPLVTIAFGSEWTNAAPILQILAVAYICNSIGNPVGALQLAKGRADLGFYWNLGLFLFLPIIMWLGSFYGLLGIASSITLFKIIISILPAWYFFIQPLCKATWKSYMYSFSHPLLISILAVILPYIVSFWINEFTAIVKLIILGLIFGLSYAILSIKFNKQIVKEIRDFFPKKFS